MVKETIKIRRDKRKGRKSAVDILGVKEGEESKKYKNITQKLDSLALFQ